MCLEKPFWLTLEQLANECELTLPQLISFIDANCRGGSGSARAVRTLASCLRVICLKWQTARAERNSAPSGQGVEISLAAIFSDFRHLKGAA